MNNNNNPFSLDGKNILITGASSGIGRQCAISLSRQGANIALVGRDSVKLQETWKQLGNGKHIVLSQDITDFFAIEDVVSKSVNYFGKISGFIHSAGIEITKPITMLNPSDYSKIFSINTIAGFEFSKILSLKKYHQEKSLSLIFISSIMSVVGNSALVAYSASKGALVAGVRSMALELAGKGIRVNAISPAHIAGTEMSDGLFATLSDEAKSEIIRMHPLGLGTVEDVANACIFLLSDASRWITGANLIIDGGYSIK